MAFSAENIDYQPSMDGWVESGGVKVGYLNIDPIVMLEQGLKKKIENSLSPVYEIPAQAAGENSDQLPLVA